MAGGDIPGESSAIMLDHWAEHDTVDLAQAIHLGMDGTGVPGRARRWGVGQVEVVDGVEVRSW
jgi:hypothetical protein